MLFLILQLNDEDYEKFTRLYMNYHDALLNYAYSILHDKHLSEEAVHDAFIRILKNLDKLSEFENERSRTWHYMVIVIRNVSFSMLKKEKPFKYQDMGEFGLSEIKDDKEPIWSEYQAKELHNKINEYIRKNLCEIDRAILTMRSVHKMAYKDIAQIVNITESNVSVRLSRLRKKMKTDLQLEEVNS